MTHHPPDAAGETASAREGEGRPRGGAQAHVIVREFIARLDGRIGVDATGEQSRFVFRPMGFCDQEGTANPCLLEYDKPKARLLLEGSL